MSERNEVTPRVTKHRFSKLAAAVGGHFLASTTLFAGFSAMFFTEQSFGLLSVGFNDAALRPDVIGPMVLIYGLAACAWALMFIIYKMFRANMSRPKHVQLKKARGTIIAETLIVLPVFFTLTFGLAQMALNSIAGLLTTLASYEVTRTLAVWAVEEGNARGGSGNVSRQHIEERARLVAAGVIAPATPEASVASPCQRGSALPQMLDGMVAAGLAPDQIGQGSVFSMSEAYGHRRFALRGPSKLVGAYCAISVNWTNVDTDPTSTGRSQFTSTLEYNHPAVMPVVAWAFAKNPGAGPWLTPYVSTISRSYQMTTYLTPNVWLPY